MIDTTRNRGESSVGKGWLGALLVASSLSFMPMQVSALPTGFHSKVLFSGMDMVSCTVLPDGRVMAVEKIGKITVLDQKTGVKTVALDWQSHTWSNFEGGMMNALPDPNFLTNGYLYIQYCKIQAVNNEDHDWVSRFTMKGNTIDPTTEIKILDEGFRGPDYHHGGGLAISPKDGMLYIGIGSRRNTSDQNQPTVAANTSRIEGKVARVKIPTGEIPTDNPFYAQNTGDAKAVYYYDNRNPFTMSFHPTTGKLWYTDVMDDNAQDRILEGQAPGFDYGFNTNKYGNGRMFNSTDAGFTGGAMVGSLWYTGDNFPAEYKDKYFFGQVRGQGSNLMYTDANHTNFTKFGPFTGNGIYSPIDIKMDAAGAIYLATRYQTENVVATAGQVIKVWYGDTEPTIPTTTVEGKLAAIAGLKMQWDRPVNGRFTVKLRQDDGVQTITLKTLDGKTLATRTASGKESVEFQVASKGVHVLTWSDGTHSGAAKIIL